MTFKERGSKILFTGEYVVISSMTKLMPLFLPAHDLFESRIYAYTFLHFLSLVLPFPSSPKLDPQKLLLFRSLVTSTLPNPMTDSWSYYTWTISSTWHHCSPLPFHSFLHWTFLVSLLSHWLLLRLFCGSSSSFNISVLEGQELSS